MGIDSVKDVGKNIPGVASDVIEKLDALKHKPPATVVIVEDLPDEIKVNYLSVLVWFVFAGDGVIDERELCAIQVLMTQLQCNADVRQTIRQCLETPQNVNAEQQVAQMLEQHESALTEQGTSDLEEAQLALRCDLMKNVIRLWRATSEGPAIEQRWVQRLGSILDLEDDKVQFLEDLCKKD